jgi:RNA ligase (TIGR02306 family)
MTRKLVTIRKISEIRPIPDADSIELVIVDGWQCVAQKSMNYKVGDYVFYFEIDSFLPFSKPEFEFLRPKDGRITVFNGVEGHRLRTIKLRKQLSQGLLVPVPLDHIGAGFVDPEDTEADYTDFWGVQLYEKPLPAQLAGTVRSTFPSFIQKTDQERIQNMFGILQRRLSTNPGEKFEVTLKLDGSSMTVYRRDDDYGVCSRNLSLKENDDNTFWKVAKKQGLFEILNKMGRNLAFQGELMGEGVQGNLEKLLGNHFFMFDIFDIDKGEYLNAEERQDIAVLFGILHVPVIAYDTLDKFSTVDDFLNYAEGPSLNAKNREGVVFKSMTDPSFSFKAISNAFLLGEKD